MTAEMHGRVRALFAEALELPKGKRLEFLQSTCFGEPEVLATVLRLLEAHQGCQTFLEDKAPGIQRIGRYLVTGELGRGAMGVVYEATDPLIGRKVAVKVIRLQALPAAGGAELLRERLYREARSAGVLSHPGIVVVFDVGEEGDLAFIAMEFVEGVSLYDVLAPGRRIPSSEAFEILRQAATALDYAHGNGVVHRDIKPANIMLDKAGRVKIADFGIAKITSTDQHTQTGMVLGTPTYMSPEQVEALPSDGRSDQFSLAVVAYELLTGVRPFQAESLATLVHMIVYADRPSARAANPALPPAVDVVLRRGLARRPNDRYPSCTEFVAALEGASKEVGMAEPYVESPAGHAHQARRGIYRPRTLLAAGACAVVLAVIDSFLGYKVLFRQHPSAAMQVAQKPAISPGVQPKVRAKSKEAEAHQTKSNKDQPDGVKSATNQVPPAAGQDAADSGTVYRVGNGVSGPTLFHKVEPDYSEAGRKLRAEGIVLLYIVVQPDGTARDLRVLTSLGYGLDEKAMEAIGKWRFHPSMKDEKPVPVEAQVEVRFHLGQAPGANLWSSGPMAFSAVAGVAAPVVKDGTMPPSGGEPSNESVVLEFTVGANGSVTNIHSIQGSESASELLGRSLATWTFRPAMKGNRLVEATGRVRFVRGQGDEAAKLPLGPPPSPSSPSDRGAAVSSRGVNLSPMDPAVVDGGVVSRGGAAARLEFINRSRNPVDIYWIDYNGNRVPYYSHLAAGASWLETTSLNHPWLVVASGTGGTTAHDTGTRLAGFQAVTPATPDPAIRDRAIITNRDATRDASSAGR